MKRFGIGVLALVLVMCVILDVSAQESNMRVVSEITEYADDGSCIVTSADGC